ncbi:PucR family transcriptional regulator [Streptomyces sp. WAC07149]|uniref:PucR family transcriptional regulator n=1 Tax=Streptomyces sp. WAC07149 TaxID=2487425 RepID=UPI000F7712CF|nr:PucR family transcriptional regulator [Streptomyces sp. WAC07149]RST02159.1 PucR family transcriptional regulator [Streptomyces sp. WAC07149]
MPADVPVTPNPAGEPMTPPVGLAALLGERGLGLRHLAGPAVAEVHGVHASEMADPSPYLLGGELLLTAGAELTEAGAAAYAGRLARAGAAALGFGVTPVHEVVPPGLAEACERYGLPLVEVPPGTPFTAVARSVGRLMAEARTRELRRVAEAQQALAAAAARPDPVPALLSRLAASLGGWAALLAPGSDPAGAGRAAAGGVPGVEVLDAVAALVRRVVPGAAATATDSLGATSLAAYAVGGGRVLALATPGRTPGDHTIASIAAVLLSLLTAERPAGDEAAALTRLLLDGDPAGALAPGPWYAVHARGGGDPGALAAALGTVLLDPRGDGVRLLTDREPGPQPGWRLGVSAPAAPGALATAAAQARRALARAEAARTPLSRHTDPGFAGLVGEAEARAHAEALLEPLSPALRDTLRGWLAHHGSWDRSAAALGVHRNTVRQRVARCAALLDRDLDDPDVRMELWFALRRLPRV